MIDPRTELSKPSFVPPLITYKRSVPIDPCWLKPNSHFSHFTDGYWLKTEPRNAARIEAELDPAREMELDWERRSGISTHTVVTPVGGILSLSLPEADLKRVAIVSALNAFAFIEDDLHDGDFLCRVPEAEREKLAKDLRIIQLRMKGKLFYDLLTTDEETIAFVEKYEHWNRSAEGENKDPKEYKDLDEFLEDRMKFGGAEYTSPLSYKEPMSLKDLPTLINDIFSCEKEWITHASADKPGAPHASGVWVTFRTHNCSLKQAIEIVKQTTLDKEQEFLRERERLLREAEPGNDYKVLEKYTGYLQLMFASYLVHAMHCPRYFVEPGSSPYCPLLEHTIDTLPRIPGSLKKGTRSIFQKVEMENGIGTEAADYSQDSTCTKTSGHLKNGCKASYLKSDESKPWLSKYPRLSDEIIMEPCDYINSLPSKRMRRFAIDALDIWYKAPARSVTIITNVIEMLHSASLIVDDIEDNSPMRRARPSTHMVFGTAQSINSANYMFVKCLEEIQKLGSAAVSVYIDELRNLHIGQGLDLHWTFHAQCPTEREYIQMIDGKTGGLFRMAARLMRLEATQNHDLDVEELLTLMGRFFQIRDDYQNLGSQDYARAKGSLSDLDEGKYSFMLIHALNTAKDSQLRSLLKLRSQQPGGVFTPEQKGLIMKCFGKTKSMEYTLEVLKDLQREIGRMLVGVEGGPVLEGQEENWMVRAVMARLRVGYDVGGYSIYRD
ncbi:hypothetical protein TWF281_003990 [Arthrobotrys megalospora]